MKPVLATSLAVLLLLSLQGCAVGMAAGSVVGTAAGVGAGAVKTTAKAVTPGY